MIMEKLAENISQNSKRKELNGNSEGTVCVFRNNTNMIFMILNITGDIFVGPIKLFFK